MTKPDAKKRASLTPVTPNPPKLKGKGKKKGGANPGKTVHKTPPRRGDKGLAVFQSDLFGLGERLRKSLTVSAGVVTGINDEAAKLEKELALPHDDNGTGPGPAGDPGLLGRCRILANALDRPAGQAIQTVTGVTPSGIRELTPKRSILVRESSGRCSTRTMPLTRSWSWARWRPWGWTW